jgi:hypothetical protein
MGADVRRVVLLALLALSCAVPAAAAAPTVGIGEQDPRIFADPSWQGLGLKDVRLVTSWDVTQVGFERREVDAYLKAADAAGARVVVAFGRTRIDSRRKVLPSPARYRRAFRAFRKRWPEVTTFIAWNEANHCSQPTCHDPARAAAYFDVLRSSCAACTVVAADVLDTPDMVGWLKAFRAAAHHTPSIWGLHNYLDANRFSTRGTRAMLGAVRGRIWFTETGGLVSRSTRSPIKFPQSKVHAAQATTWLFSRLVRLSDRVQRVYVYHWTPAMRPGDTWDSALVDKRGHPRPALDVLRLWVGRFARARRARAG